MATQKPTSTISYNTEPFLKEKLEDWYQAHLIQAYMYIKHKGEDGDKDHIHLRIVPNKRLDVMELTELLKEFDPANVKPLGVRPWQNSKEEDWILYAVHDPEYMRLKYPNDKKEKIPYSWKDIVASESFDVETAYIRAKAAMTHNASNLVQRISNGESPITMIAEGNNPFLINQIQRLVVSTSYNELFNKYSDLVEKYDKIVNALNDADLDIMVDDEGIYHVTRYNPTNVFDEETARKKGLKTIRRKDLTDAEPVTKMLQEDEDLPY